MLSAAVFFPVNRLAKTKTSIGLVEFHSLITTKHRKKRIAWKKAKRINTFYL